MVTTVKHSVDASFKRPGKSDVEPDQNGRRDPNSHWVDSVVDATVEGMAKVRDEYRRRRQRSESLYGRLSRRVRRASERRRARRPAHRDRLTPWWTWAALLGTMEAVGGFPGILDLGIRSDAFASVMTDVRRFIQRSLGRTEVRDPVMQWMLERLEPRWTIVCYPAVLLLCALIVRRGRPRSLAARTFTSTPARMVGTAATVAYLWHLIATRCEGLLFATANLAPLVILCAIPAILVLHRIIAGPARRT
jgi:hypothetical protein